jgi:hypothetical protein
VKIKKIIRLIILLLCVCIVTGIGLFLYNAYHGYSINSGFTSISLNYNPDDSTSSYRWNGADITIHGGFVKGIQKSSTGDSLVIRALSPLPAVEIKNSNTSIQNISINIENINPEFYASSIDKSLAPSRIAVNTLEFSLSVDAEGTKRINPSQPNDTEDDNYVILGDSRDGYETFDKIIAQVNALNPVFVIDNGDLVYSGNPTSTAYLIR